MNALQIMSPRLVPIDWNKVENDKFKLPLLFKIFHNSYDISTIGNYFSFAYINSNRVTTFGHYSHPIFKGVLDTIYELEDLDKQNRFLIKHNRANDIEPFAEKIIPIAWDPSGTMLMLGVGEENSDIIYHYISYDDERLQIVANNIFEFFRDYHIKINEFHLHQVPFENLYRNWDDKFWRVREEKDVAYLIDEKDKELAQIKEEKDKYYYQLKKLARAEKMSGVPLEKVSEKYGFSVEDLEKSYF